MVQLPVTRCCYVLFCDKKGRFNVACTQIVAHALPAGHILSSLMHSVVCLGVDAESVLKLRGQGDAGCSGGASGDLYITFLVKASAGIRRTGLDLYSEVWTSQPLGEFYV